MFETTEIEKKSLEAHAELCAERYSALDEKISNVESKITSLEIMLKDVSVMIQDMSSSRQQQILSWTIATIVGLLGIVGWFLVHYVIK